MVEELRDTFSDKRVFLTGHTGFKGSWLAFLLNHLGAKVKGYALEPEEENALYTKLRVDTFTESIFADVNDKEKLEKEFLKFKPDFVFHMAAQSLVITSYDEPVNTFETNVMGTVNLLDAMRKYDQPCTAVVVTTDKVYENIEQEYAYKESDKLGGFDPYSSSKAACEIATASYRNSFFNPSKYDMHQKSLSTARSGNVIGGGDMSENRIIPDLIRAIQSKQKLEIRNPKSVRPWQHLLDPLSGYLLLAVRMSQDPVEYADAYNFGPVEDVNLTVEELVKKAINAYGEGEFMVSEILQKQHEANLLHLNTAKAQKTLGWKPKLNADDAIKMTMEWYREAQQDPFSITFKQTTDYLNL